MTILPCGPTVLTASPPEISGRNQQDKESRRELKPLETPKREAVMEWSEVNDQAPAITSVPGAMPVEIRTELPPQEATDRMRKASAKQSSRLDLHSAAA
ncbi:hypothetical protein OJ996_19935 [Luteolibacter sp. GHJ8]|uniref:Uncharacterized protein n=1 Tax=Luteolibacter rhizosphaerae TaxID=2989719 RepID=A0ABT3G7N5_9BACT|nr:hypothetical protein [Luteolibacter rhizosphaerae]MCW1915868.1 hypothetical protein [Luteolibacter rhizosphaerae]